MCVEDIYIYMGVYICVGYIYVCVYTCVWYMYDYIYVCATFLYFLGQVPSDALCSSRELRWEGEGHVQNFPLQEQPSVWASPQFAEKPGHLLVRVG